MTKKGRILRKNATVHSEYKATKDRKVAHPDTKQKNESKVKVGVKTKGKKKPPFQALLKAATDFFHSEHKARKDEEIAHPDTKQKNEGKVEVEVEVEVKKKPPFKELLRAVTEFEVDINRFRKKEEEEFQLEWVRRVEENAKELVEWEKEQKQNGLRPVTNEILVPEIEKALENVSSVLELDLADKIMGSSLPPHITQLKFLQNLNVEGCNLDTIPVEMGKMYNLQALNLNRNNIKKLPSSCILLTSLKVLSMRKNNLRDIPRIIFHINSLIELDVSYNYLTSISPRIAGLSSLRVLMLDNNEITQISDGISCLKDLKILSLNHNKLQKQPNIGNCERLVSLNLKGKTNGRFKVNPKALKRLRCLKTLNLPPNLLKWESEIWYEISLRKLERRLEKRKKKLNKLSRCGGVGEGCIDCIIS
eukprot:g784.t1